MRKLRLLMLAISLLAGQLILAQTKTVTGKVTDSRDNSPVAGATISIGGRSVGVTSLTGEFTVTIPASTTKLGFSSIGYDDIEVNIGTGPVNVTMTLGESKNISEVVVTGYTTVQRKKFSGATANISPAEVRKQPFGSFDQALQGAAAGVSAVANSGQPGANAIVRIRGNGSISGGNVPLYIVDGIEVNAADFSAMNQGDFERVEVLKDGVATAMYGSRGANGVIVITTRRGRAGQINLNYDTQFGLSDLPENRLIVMNSNQKIDYELQRGNPYGWTTAEADSLRMVNFNWQDALFRQGMTQMHQISASGGGTTSRFYGSLSFMDQEGIVKTTGMKRYTARINVDNTIKNWRFGLSLQGGYSKIAQTPEGNTFLSSPLNAIRWSNPYERDKYPEGHPLAGQYQETGGVGTGQLGSGQPNGAMELFLNYNFNHQLKGIGVTYLEFHFPFLKGLHARTNWGIDFTSNEFEQFTSPRVSVGIARQGNLARDYNRNLRYTGTTSLNYKTTFGEHEIEAGLFTEVVKNQFRSMGFTGFGLTNGLQNEAGITPGSATNSIFIPVVRGNGTQSGLLSYFTIINYGYAGKYYLTLVGRRDGSSRFGLNNQFANFGSAGVTWVVSDERFLANSKNIDELRLRASIGTNGNNLSPGGDFGHIAQLGRITYSGINGWAPGAPGNPDLRWETNRTINFGLDFAMFNRRLSGTVELYDRKTIDQFWDEPASAASGAPGGSIPGNVGAVRNRGVEFTLRGDIFRTRDFRWTVEGNITYNQNRILELSEDSIPQGTTILAIGKPLGSFYLVEYAGVNSANGNALYYTRNAAGEKNVTQTYSINDRQILGTSISPLFGGISSTVSYKGFELSAHLVFFLKRQMFNNDRNNLTNPTYYFDNMHVELLKEWRQPGDVTDIPRPSSSAGNAYQASTTRFLEDASYWRLRNVTLAYNLPNSLLSKAKIKSARVFVQGQNWWTQTRYLSFDPEFSGGVLTGSQYPALIQTTFGLSVGF